MGLRLIHVEGKNAGGMARVYRDNDWQEYRVKFYRDGVYEGAESDHHTDDKGDAIATAQLWVKRPRIGNGVVLSEGDDRQEMIDAIARTPEDQRQSFFLSLSHEKQALARDILGDTAFDKYVWAKKPTRFKCSNCQSSFLRLPGVRETKCPYCDTSMERASNPETGPAGSTIQTQAEVNEFVRKMNETTLFAAGAYGRTPKIKDWQNGKDFVALDPPKWEGGRYFSIRDVETIYNLGYRKIVFGGHEGFDVELVMQ